MFYNRGMSQVGFPFERNNGNGDDDDNNDDSAPFPLLPYIQPRCTTPHRHHHEQRGKTMKMGENGKRKGIPTDFWRGSTMTCPNFPSLIFSLLQNLINCVGLVAGRPGACLG